MSGQYPKIKKCTVEKTLHWISNPTDLDCADLALTALAECSAQYNVKLSIPVYDAAGRKCIILKSSSYPNTAKFAEALRANLGAISLIDQDKVTLPRRYEDLQLGDLIVYDLRPQKNPNYTGHTMVVLENDPKNKKLTVGQGHLSDPPDKETIQYSKLSKFDHPDGSKIGPVDGKGRVWNWDKIAD